MNHIRFSNLLTVAVLALLFAGCRKEPIELVNPDDPNYRPKTYVEQFEAIWHGIDNGYLFWGRDTTDWDRVYKEYLPVFQEFDAKGGASSYEYYKAYQGMVSTLLDHHFSLQARDPVRGHWAYAMPGSAEVTSRDYYHSTDIAKQVSVLRRRSKMQNSKIVEFVSNTNSCGSWYAKIKTDVANKYIHYFRLEGFQATYLYWSDDSTRKPFEKFYGTFLNGFSKASILNTRPEFVAGIIIDVRGNGGGIVDELTPLVGALSPTDRHFGYSRIKEGLGRLDYSAWSPFTLKTHENHLQHEYPIVVLADCNSVSCAEITTQFIKSLPNGTFIGERTWGGTCMLMPGQHDVLYSGVFGDINRNGYYVYTSNFDMVLTDYTSLEGVGVMPDIECFLDQDMLERGTDNQFERAVEFINTGK